VLSSNLLTALATTLPSLQTLTKLDPNKLRSRNAGLVGAFTAEMPTMVPDVVVLAVAVAIVRAAKAVVVSSVMDVEASLLEVAVAAAMPRDATRARPLEACPLPIRKGKLNEAVSHDAVSLISYFGRMTLNLSPWIETACKAFFVCMLL